MINGCVYDDELYMDDNLFNDYYTWYTRAKECLPREELMILLRRIHMKEIKRARRIKINFDKQFD